MSKTPELVTKLCDLHCKFLGLLEERIGIHTFYSNEISEIASLLLDAATSTDKQRIRSSSPSSHELAEARRLALEEAAKLVEGGEWKQVTWEETAGDTLENIAAAIRSLNHEGETQ